ncbi:MOB kinase activator 1A [Aduncisulcus paluster]|uniref:MOB kinase activator 1A n=1 Tax=Aduncisulcus paluster TaxID=2918883 RepID=A0ABQ5K0M5_9EUKA|nr:MOB kinase activator 1A [Aduncisulcus paluster]
METILAKKLKKSADPTTVTLLKKRGSERTGRTKKELETYAHATLGTGNLKEAVKLPEGEDLFEWLASNTVDFYNAINMLYCTVSEVCTKASCPVMNAGPKYEYLWADGEKIKTPIRVSAPDYITYLMAWVEKQISDTTIFPHKWGAPFPSNFREIVRNIFKRMFRVYAHIYFAHFQVIVEQGEQAHLNTCFKHFIFFADEFQLIQERELAPMKELIERYRSE